MRSFGSKPLELDVSLISHDTVNLREINSDIVKELMDSIKSQGLQQPICVRRSTTGYIVIFGEHRLEAFKVLGKPTIPAFIRQADDFTVKELKITENIQRNNFINPIIEGQIYNELIQKKYKIVSRLAEKIGKSPHYIEGRIAISLRLDDSLKPMVGKELGIQACIAISKIPDKKKQVEFANELMKMPKPYERLSGFSSTGSAVVRRAERDCICPKCDTLHVNKNSEQAKKRINDLRWNQVRNE